MTSSTDTGFIRRSLLAGLFTNLAEHVGNGRYQTVQNTLLFFLLLSYPSYHLLYGYKIMFKNLWLSRLPGNVKKIFLVITVCCLLALVINL